MDRESGTGNHMEGTASCDPITGKLIALLLAIGYVFVGVNLTINGLAILLPTCVGYGLLAIGFWEAASKQGGVTHRFSQFAFGLCVFMAIVTVPLLVRFSYAGEGWEAYSRWTFHVWYIEVLISLVSPVALWNVFPSRSVRGLMLSIILTYPLAWWATDVLYEDHRTISLLIGGALVPLYSAAVFWWAYKQGDAPKSRR